MSKFNVTGEVDFAVFAQQGLKVHNEFRNIHGVPDLQLTKELCDFAQVRADESAKKGKISTKDHGEYGENTYCAAKDKSPDVIREAIQSWYAEISKHNFDTENIKKRKSLAFSQLVWNDTTELGFGMATNSKGKIFIVANYWPKGNRPGEFLSNVPRAVNDS